MAVFTTAVRVLNRVLDRVLNQVLNQAPNQVLNTVLNQALDQVLNQVLKSAHLAECRVHKCISTKSIDFYICLNYFFHCVFTLLMPPS